MELPRVEPCGLCSKPVEGYNLRVCESCIGLVNTGRANCVLPYNVIIEELLRRLSQNKTNLRALDGRLASLQIENAQLRAENEDMLEQHVYIVRNCQK